MNSALSLHERFFKRHSFTSYGFTFIELVAVFATISILSGIGLLSLSSYIKQQAVTGAAQDFVTAASLARSQAQSQVKPTTGSCATKPLDGYRVSLTCNATSVCTAYQLTAVCGGVDTAALKSGSFPTGVTVTSAVSSFLYPIFQGNVQGLSNGASNDVVFTGPGASQVRVTLYYDGRISGSD